MPFATAWKCHRDLNYPLLVTKGVQVDPKDYQVLSEVLSLACAEKHLGSFSTLPMPRPRPPESLGKGLTQAICENSPRDSNVKPRLEAADP